MLELLEQIKSSYADYSAVIEKESMHKWANVSLAKA